MAWQPNVQATYFLMGEPCTRNNSLTNNIYTEVNLCMFGCSGFVSALSSHAAQTRCTVVSAKFVGVSRCVLCLELIEPSMFAIAQGSCVVSGAYWFICTSVIIQCVTQQVKLSVKWMI
jgi:hypothetical protein